MPLCPDRVVDAAFDRPPLPSLLVLQTSPAHLGEQARAAVAREAAEEVAAAMLVALMYLQSSLR